MFIKKEKEETKNENSTIIVHLPSLTLGRWLVWDRRFELPPPVWKTGMLPLNTNPTYKNFMSISINGNLN